MALKLKTGITFKELVAQSSLFTNLNQPLAIINVDLEVEFANRSFLMLVNSKVRVIKTPKPYLDFFSFKTQEQNILERVKREAVRLNEREIFIVDGDNEEHSVTIQASPFNDDTKQLAGFLLELDDKTDELRVHERFNKIIDDLKEANRQALSGIKAKDEFIATISHELRTPLNGILGMAELTLDSVLDEEQFQSIRTIRDSGNILLSLINDILDFSKLNSNKMQLEKVSFNIYDILDEIMRIMQYKCMQKNIEIRLQRDEKLPKVLMGDPGRLRQIFMNLIGNAIKFTDEGHVELGVRVEEVSKEHACCVFEVKDTGIGIPEDKLKNLFSAFTQADASTTRKFGGTGLGLSISKSLIDLMQGEIHVESEDGLGSNFWFRVKFEKGDETEVVELDEFEKGHGKISSLILSQHRKYDDLFKQMSKVCRSENTQVYLPSDDVLDMLAKGKHNVVIISHSEYQAVEALVAQIHQSPDFRHLPIVVIMDGGGMKGDAQALAAKGVSAYLTLPITPSQVGECVMKVLSQDMKPQAQITKYDLNAPKNPLHILVVEDNLINQKVATRMLKKMGHYSELANNGQEGLDMMKQNRYDLVLMDMQMPIMSGIDATQKFRDQEKDKNSLPILAVTANATEQDRIKCKEAGMTDFISKPIKSELLSKKIDEWGYPSPQ